MIVDASKAQQLSLSGLKRCNLIRMINSNRFKSRPWKRFAVLSISLMFAGGGIAACGQFPDRPVSETPTPAPQDSLKIGALLPYTGTLAAVGQPMIEVLPLIVDQANACGGVNGGRVSLTVKDDQSQPGRSATALAQMIETDQVDAAIVGFVSGNAPGVLDVAVQQQVPIVSPASTSSAFTEQAKQGRLQGYWARTVPSEVHQARALARLAIERRYKTASTLVIDNDDGVSFEEAFATTFEELGGTVLNRESPTRYDPQTVAPVYTTLDAFRPYAGRPAAVVAFLDPSTGSTLLQSAYEQGLTDSVQIMLTPGVQPRSLLEAVGKRYDGKYILAGTIGILPGAGGAAQEELEELWQQQQGDRKIGVFVAHTWDAAALIMLAAEAAQSNEGSAIQQHIRAVANPSGIEVTDVCTGLRLLKEGQEINYQGASGKVDLDENGDVFGNYNVWTATDQGQIEVIRQVKFEK